MDDNRERLLVVDDDAEVTTLLFDVLEACGYQVTCAANGAEALTLLRENIYDLVLTDLNMPFIDGLKLRSVVHDLYPLTAVLLMTGGSNKDFVIPTSLTVITKPFSLDTMKNQVRETIANQKEKKKP